MIKHNSNDDIHVLITAAGCSRRMKQFKPLMPLGNSCILESTIRNFRTAGLHNLTVVVGYRKQSLIPLLRKHGVRIVENPAYDETDMLESVKLGLQAILPDAGAVFLCPADVALLSPFTIREMVRAFTDSPVPVLIPTYHQANGHPPLLSREAAWEILNYQGDCGVRGVLQQFDSETRYLEVPDSEILEDTDLPEDYERLKAAWQNRGIPSRQTCFDIWNYVDTPDRVRAHCLSVEQTALKLAEDYQQRSASPKAAVNTGMLSAAALLHDMLRTSPNHAHAAADLLTEMCYDKISPMVRYHKNLPLRFHNTVNETTLLYLSDRLVIDSSSATLEEKYREKTLRYAGNPQAVSRIKADRKIAEHLYEMIRGEKP